MIALIVFNLALFGLSLTLTYAWWTKFRVDILQYDLATLRDELTDLMANRLNDPHFIDLHRMLTRLIQIAPELSPVMFDEQPVRSTHRPPADHGAVPAEVAVIRYEAGKVIDRYMRWWCLTGWFRPNLPRLHSAKGAARPTPATDWVSAVDEQVPVLPAPPSGSMSATLFAGTGLGR